MTQVGTNLMLMQAILVPNGLQEMLKHHCFSFVFVYYLENPSSYNIGVHLGLNYNNLASSWANFGPTWANFGPTWVNLGQLGPTCGQLGTNLGPTWANLAPIWCQLKPIWCQLGSMYMCMFMCMRICMRNLGPTCANLCQSGPNWGQFGINLCLIWLFLVQLHPS